MKKKCMGVSMIALIITIVVLVILTGVIVLKLTDTNIMELGNEGSFKANIKTYEADLADYIGNQDMEHHGKYDKELLFADRLAVRYAGDDITGATIKDVIPSLSEKDLDKFIIEEGKLRYAGVKAKEQNWAKEVGIGTTVSYIKDHMILWLDGINNMGVGHGNNTATWKDLSGKQNNAILSGFTFNEQSGWNENSLKFNGYMYGSVKGNTDFSQFKAGKPFSYGATFKTGEAVTTWTGVLTTVKANADGNSGVNGFNIQFGTRNNIGTFFGGTSTSYLVKEDEVVTPSTNYSVFVTYNGSVAKLYINGELANSTTVALQATTEELLLGGFYTKDKGGKFSLYGVYFYDKELSAEEVKYNYQVDKARFGI